jgi:CubicO group peptidase (beta-lactamase class C family)
VIGLVPDIGIHDNQGWLPAITVRQLLDHTSGIFRGLVGAPPSWSDTSDNGLNGYWTSTQAATDAPLTFPPGSFYDYSNFASVWLGWWPSA